MVGLGAMKLQLADRAIKILQGERHVANLKRWILEDHKQFHVGDERKLEVGLYSIHTPVQAMFSWHTRLGHISGGGVKEFSKQKLLGKNNI